MEEKQLKSELRMESVRFALSLKTPEKWDVGSYANASSLIACAEEIYQYLIKE